MSKLNAKRRNALPDSAFAGPDRSFPVNDRSHAANAKARASQQVNAGRMSPSTEAKIDSKANKVLGKLPERGERTETNKRTRGDGEAQHPQSHDEWEQMGRD
jgi:hypothetical protein